MSRNWVGTVVTLNSTATEESLPLFRLFRQIFSLLKRERVEIALVPSYWPAQCLVVLLAARLAGVRCVMMNDSHAGTARATGFKRFVKKQLLRLFDSALLAGTPQKQHFIALGMAAEKVFLGYDVVDNEYFSQKSIEAGDRAAEMRERLGLPEKYILNLGRMVAKKNLHTLVDAYSQLADLPHGLVLIGNGPDEKGLRSQALKRGLLVKDLKAGHPPEHARRTVFFGGFRQIDENPTLFSIADVFVLPSHTEEWGLVVNEAMACGLPILVSRNVGSAHDLVHDGVNGFKFDPENAEELSRLIRSICSNTAQRTKMGLESRRIIANWGVGRFAEGASQAIGKARLKKSANRGH
jgi:glycosyltransferase involved in cell wall biosynthesis